MPKRNLRVGIFVDAANTGICAWKTLGRKVDYKKLMEYILEDNFLYRAMVYAVRFGEKMDSWTNTLTSFGYEVKIKEPVVFLDGHKKANCDSDMIMDAVIMIDHVDILVIVSGDGDFRRLAKWAQDKGKIVHVVAVESSTNRELMIMADVFKPITLLHTLIPLPPPEEQLRKPVIVRREDDGHRNPDISEEDRKKLDAEIEAVLDAEVSV